MYLVIVEFNLRDLKLSAGDDCRLSPRALRADDEPDVVFELLTALLTPDAKWDRSDFKACLGQNCPRGHRRKTELEGGRDDTRERTNFHANDAYILQLLFEDALMDNLQNILCYGKLVQRLVVNCETALGSL